MLSKPKVSTRVDKSADWLSHGDALEARVTAMRGEALEATVAPCYVPSKFDSDSASLACLCPGKTYMTRMPWLHRLWYVGPLGVFRGADGRIYFRWAAGRFRRLAWPSSRAHTNAAAAKLLSKQPRPPCV